MADWRFYGREKELAKIREYIDMPDFAAGLILGGRGIGKTELLRETRGRMGRRARMLIFELKDPALEDPAAANRRLIDETRHILGETASIPPPRPDLFPVSAVYGAYPPQEYFVDLIRHLVHHNVTVCLDEFHMAKPMKLEGGLKLLIDRSYSLRGDRPPGKLILMGSHQQQVLDMFRSTEPLHLRATAITRLRQWRMPTLFAMAAEQGFLQRPGRLLSLWCAFGGVPGNWRRFASGEAGQLADFNAWDNDDAWRAAFLDWHRELLQDSPRERFDSKAFIELAPPAREALLWLARRHPRGTILSRFPAELRSLPGNALEDALDMLRDHLGMIERFGPFMVEGPLRWRIADNSTLYQIHVHPELFGRSDTGRHGPPGPGGPGLPLHRLQTLEGVALERMAAACLSSQPNVTWSAQGVWRNRGAGGSLPDIDVMATRGWWNRPGSVLVLGSCKRNAGKHDTDALDRHFDDFLCEIGGKDGVALRTMTREKLLFSPVFSPEQRDQHAGAGFQSMDMHDMARAMGIEPEPPVPTSPPEEPGEDDRLPYADPLAIPDPYEPPSPFDG